MTATVKYYEPRRDGVKICRTCKRELPRVQFGIRRRNTDGRLNTCHECEGDRHSRAKHGITQQEKAGIAKAQGGCAICHRRAPGWLGWVVDHDRSCCPGERSCPKCRRGVVCNWCNSAIGLAQDSPSLLRAMADYLDAHATGITHWHLPEASPRRMSTEKDGRNGRDGDTGFSDLETQRSVTREGALKW